MQKTVFCVVLSLTLSLALAPAKGLCAGQEVKRSGAKPVYNTKIPGFQMKTQSKTFLNKQKSWGTPKSGKFPTGKLLKFK